MATSFWRAAALALPALFAGCSSESTSPMASPDALPSAPRDAQVDWQRSAPIRVEMSEFDFAPDRLVLQVGQPYDLHIVNIGSVGHTFSAPAFFRTVTFGPAGAQAPLESGSVSLGAKESADVRLVPLQAGRYPLECTRLLHANFGMTGEIVVR